MLVQVALVNTDHATAVDSDTRVSVRTATLEHTVTVCRSLCNAPIFNIVAILRILSDTFLIFFSYNAP